VESNPHHQLERLEVIALYTMPANNNWWRGQDSTCEAFRVRFTVPDPFGPLGEPSELNPATRNLQKLKMSLATESNPRPAEFTSQLLYPTEYASPHSLNNEGRL